MLILIMIYEIKYNIYKNMSKWWKLQNNENIEITSFRFNGKNPHI